MAKNCQLIGPLEKFGHGNKNHSATSIILLIAHIMLTFYEISIYGLGGDRF
jgi:hypothetical protein